MLLVDAPLMTSRDVPKVFRFCVQCQKETPHEIVADGTRYRTVCLPCLEQTLLYELDRD